MQVILYQNEDKVSILSASPGFLQSHTIEDLAAKDVPSGVSYLIKDVSDLPSEDQDRWLVDWDTGEITVGPELLPPLRPLTARQIRLALLSVMGTGYDAQVTGAINAAIADETEKAAALIAWEYATQFQRDEPLVMALGVALGMTSEQIDTLWRQFQDV